MRFFLHGVIHPETQAALVRHDHACHTALELSQQTDAGVEVAGEPALLLPLLEKKQWQLVTSDSEFVQRIYEMSVAFTGTIVLLLDAADAKSPLADQAKAIDRLFERYHRLAPRRMYTVTPSRVKIRQLPGAAQR